YWVRQVREPVRFADAVNALDADLVLELGPDTVLATLISNTVHDDDEAATAPRPDHDDAVTAMAASRPGHQEVVTAVAALRRGHDEVATLLTALGELYRRGTSVDWSAVLGDGPIAALPTYPFQHRRFWPRPRDGGSRDALGLGLADTGHPLLGAAVEAPDATTALFTGWLSLSTHPWLADHVVLGRPLVPGTALAEMARAAGEHVGVPVVEELLLQAPLPLPAQGGVQLRVTLAEPGPDSRRTVTVHARTEDDESWISHATGVLTASAEPTHPGFALAEPAHPSLAHPSSASGKPTASSKTGPVWNGVDGAEPLDLTGFYTATAATGLVYGPAFQGLRTVHRRGDDIFAEVELDHPVTGYGLHPALFDAVLHAIAAGGMFADGETRLPFAVTGLRVFGTAGNRLLARLTRTTGADAVRITITDPADTPVAEVDSLALRPATAGVSTGAADRLLYTVTWTPQDIQAAPEAPHVITLGQDLPAALTEPGTTQNQTAAAPAATGIRPPVLLVDATAPGTARDRAADLLRLVQNWLAAPEWSGSRLVVRTHGAAGEKITDPDGAALWGLVRAVQSEHPDRVHLLDGPDDVYLPVPQALSRDGVVRVPRLSRVPAAAPIGLGDGVVVVTGATGTLGELITRHLVDRYGVRDLLLLSRTGRSLAVDGVRVRALACDVADPDAVSAALRDEPVTAVIHAAGVLDDGIVESLTPERLDTVFRTKIDAARNLVAATRDKQLTAVVLYSSAAGVLGNAGQANYAAANAFLDAYASNLRAEGVPVTSLAWGLWEAGMGASLSDAERARARQGGILPLTPEQGLAAFDAALGAGHAAVAPLALDLAPMRVAAAAGLLPPLLAGLVRVPVRANAGTDNALARRLAGLPTNQRERAALDLVRTHVAGVLGYPGPDAVEADRAFRELGFDSLTAVDLRNRLATVTGLRLPSTLVFDYPNAQVLAGHLATELAGPAPAATVPTAATPVTAA
ncbi:type I polyketide synthase, partial [Actinoplanes derwentensis]